MRHTASSSNRFHPLPVPQTFLRLAPLSPSPYNMCLTRPTPLAALPSTPPPPNADAAPTSPLAYRPLTRSPRCP